MTEAEFVDWFLWFEWREEMLERGRKGLPIHDPDAVGEMTAEESAQHLHNLFGGRARKKPKA